MRFFLLSLVMGSTLYAAAMPAHAENAPLKIQQAEPPRKSLREDLLSQPKRTSAESARRLSPRERHELREQLRRFRSF
ncbi:MAG: hypothetical protein OEY75_04610 [Hylemonella sp.]|nr:hypothetical protein [Hylemonella sp.]MDH5708373.1 hypothetical protein [Hylemonella sp.]